MLAFYIPSISTLSYDNKNTVIKNSYREKFSSPVFKYLCFIK